MRIERLILACKALAAGGLPRNDQFNLLVAGQGLKSLNDSTDLQFFGRQCGLHAVKKSLCSMARGTLDT